jgi:drug/metabolite transporter (DMT)-like permease
MTQRVDARTALLMTLPPLMWAGNAVIGRVMVGVVPPLTLNALRWVLAALVLLPLGWRVLRNPGVWLARWRYLLPLGLLGVGAYNALQYQALTTTTPINVTLIAASSPVWMMLVGALFWRVPPTRAQWVGSVMTVSGALVVIARGSFEALASIRFAVGDLLIIVAIICWSFYSWMLSKPPASMTGEHALALQDGAGTRPWSWTESLLVQTLFGLLGAGTAALVEQGQGVAPIVWDAKTALVLAFVALGPSIVAYRCWGLGVAAGGPTLAAFFANLTPVFAAILSSIVLGEGPRAYHLVAFALILAGIVWSQRSR